MIILRGPNKAFDEIQVISGKLDLSHFDCGNTDFNDYIKNEALGDYRNKISVTYIGLVAGRPVSFVTLVAAAYRTEFIRTPVPGVHRYRQIPATKIARIATDISCQRKGYGEALVQHSVAVGFAVQALIGCTLIITDALPDRIQWYQRQGFLPSVGPEKRIGRTSCPMYAVLSG